MRSGLEGLVCACVCVLHPKESDDTDRRTREWLEEEPLSVYHVITTSVKHAECFTVKPSTLRSEQPARQT